MKSERKYYNEYVSGNTVRKLDTAPDYGRERQKTSERHFSEKTSRTNKPVGIDLFSFMVLSVAIVATVLVCLEFLQTQQELLSKSKQIASLESQIVSMKNENIASYEKINASVDLTDIYKVATQKLGMVHAKKDQVVTYQSTKSNFVKQFGKMPNGKDNGLLGKMFD